MSDLLKQIQSKRQNIADKKTGSKNAYKFKQKNTTIRILPTWRDEEDGPFFHDFGQAFIKDLDGNLLAVIGDRKMTFGEDDPVRNLIQYAQGDASSDAGREHYKGMLAKQRHLVNALVLNDKDVNPSEPQIVDFSQTQLDLIFAQMEKILMDGENPLDLAAGYDLDVEKEGTGLNTRYKFLFARRPSKVDPSVMENVTNLDAYVRSKFQDTDRAINAIKAISQDTGTVAGGTITAPSRSLSYGDSSKSEESVPWETAEYTVVDDARDTIREPISTNGDDTSAEAIEAKLRELGME